MPINFSSTKKSLSNEDLASFNLEVYSRARQLQNLRSGLLSNSDALRTATFEVFSKGLMAINCALEHARLFGGDTKEEQIQAMKEYALTSSGATKEASDIVENMLDRFSTEYQMTKSHNVVPSTEQVNNVKNVEKESRKEKNEDCCAP